jgi:hypothetical protein
MKTKYIQSDIRWKDFEIVKGATIGDFGCLLTAITNCLNEYKYEYTPLTLCKELQTNGGFDKDGCILWDILTKLFGVKHTKFKFPDKPVLENVHNIFYIVQVVYKNTGHFCQIIRSRESLITYFDSYTGKEIVTDTFLSIRKLVID